MSLMIIVLTGCLWFAVGLVTGILSALATRKNVGTFIINKSDPSKELFAIRFDKDFDHIEQRKYIVFQVKIK